MKTEEEHLIGLDRNWQEIFPRPEEEIRKIAKAISSAPWPNNLSKEWADTIARYAFWGLQSRKPPL